MESTATDTSLLQCFLDTSRNGIVLFQALRDAEGTLQDLRIDLLNTPAERILGRSAGWLTGQRFTHLFPELLSTDRFPRIWAVADTGEPFSYEVFRPTPADGQSRWFEISLAKFGDGVAANFCDITDRKQTELERDRQHALLERVFNNSLLGVSVLEAIRDAAGTVTDFQLVRINPAGARISHQIAEDVVGKTIREIYPMTDRYGMFGDLLNVLETGQPVEVERYYPDQNRWYIITANQLGDGAVITYQDITTRKQTESERDQQNTLLENLFSSVSLGFAQYEAVRESYTADSPIVNFRLLRINDTALKMSGFARTDMLGRLATEINPNHKTSGMFDQFVAVCQTGEPYSAEVYYPQFSGWFAIELTKLAEGIVISSQQITARKQAELRIQDQADTFEGVLRSLLTGLSVLKIIRDEQGELADLRYEHVSDKVLIDTGLTREQLVGQAMFSLFPGVRQSKFWTAYQVTASTGQAQAFEDHYQYDGIDNYVLGQVTPLTGDRLVSIYQIANDLKRAQREAEQQTEHLQFVLNSSLAAIAEYEAIRNPAGEIDDFYFRSFSQMAEQITGLKAEQVVGARMLEMFPAVGEIGLFAKWVQLVETGKPVRFTDYYNANGIEFWYDTHAVKWNDGFIQSYVDISPVKRKQSELEQANLELQRSNDNLQSFAYVASHDLQEPLRKIESFGSLLSNQFGPQLGETGRDYLVRMQTAAQRMSLLIRDLLAYSRLGTQREIARPVSLATIVKELLDDLDTTISESGATVSVDSLPTVRGERQQLRQLFQNLLTNALKFRQTGPTGQPIAPVVAVTHRLMNRAEVSLPLPPVDARKAVEPFCEICVIDNGIGFDEKHLDRIFQVFQRLHGKNQYAGSGVGLAIVKKVAENHGGTVTAHSQPGQGATFCVYLPV